MMERMLGAMKERAPDGVQVHCDGPVDLGQAFLRTGKSGAESPNRLTLDGQVWIIADARIDGRAELLRALRARGRQAPDDAPHAELILHAYHAFGDAFVDHLIGDFAFALWDARREKLICVRDHFGVRPFYYCDSGESFLFASDIEALLTDSSVSRRVDERAVTHFLLLGLCEDEEQTIYRGIRCLPPATRLEVSRIGATRHRYWQLPSAVETRFSSRTEYIHRFSELFAESVKDRLPDGPVGVQLSGGMDSTAIAALAAEWSRLSPRSVTGYNVSCRSIEPQDEEEHFARLTAHHLGIPLVCQELGDYPLFARGADPALRTAFPLSYPHLAAHHDTLSGIAASGGRVILSGYSGDAVLAASPTYYPDLLRKGQAIKFVREITHHLRHVRSLKGLGFRSLYRRRRADPAWKPPMPDWLDPVLAGSCDAHSMWERWWAQHTGAVDAPSMLRLPWIPRQFEATEILKLPVVGRYPFHDLRLVNFLLGLPPFLLDRKTILRDAMHGRLPEPVRLRPKTAAPGDYVRKVVTNGKVRANTLGVGAGLPPQVVPERFAEAWDRYCAGAGSDSTWASCLLMQTIALGNWLSQNGEELGK